MAGIQTTLNDVVEDQCLVYDSQQVLRDHCVYSVIAALTKTAFRCSISFRM